MLTTRLKVLIGILGVSLSFLVYDTFQQSSKKPKAPPPAPKEVSQPEPVTKPTVSKPRTRRRLTPQTPAVLAATVGPTENWGRNPFFSTPKVEEVATFVEPTGEGSEVPVLRKTIDIPDLTVSAITWNPQRARALINGRFVEKGDVIEGMMIIDINERSVTLRGGGKTLTLEVGS